MTAALGAAAFVAASLLFIPFIYSDEPRWAVLYVLGACGIISARHLRRDELVWLLFIGWAALSLIWSPDSRYGAIGLSSMIALWGLYVGASRANLNWIPEAAGIAVVGAILLWFLYRPLEGGFGNQNWITEFVCLALPLSLSRRWGWGIAAGAVFWLLWFNSSYTELAVAAGVGATLLWRFDRRAGIAASGFLLALAVWMVLEGDGDFASSFRSRLELWFNTGAMFAERPFLGHGLGGFNYVYPLFQERHLAVMDGTLLMPVNVYAGQVHNEFIQCLAELGVVGLGLGLWGLWETLKGARWSPALLTLTAALPIALIAFPTQTPASIGLIVLAGASLHGGGLGQHFSSLGFSALSRRLSSRRIGRAA